MKTKSTQTNRTRTHGVQHLKSNRLLAVGMLLALVGTAVGQSTLQFSSNTYKVAESAEAVTLILQRSNDLASAVTVDYATADGTATHGVKYTAVAGTLTFGVGESNQIITVPILNDGFLEANKSFRVILANPSSGAVLGPRTNATVSITDNDVGIQFQFATNAVAEDAGAVLLGIVRGDDGDHPVTVELATTDLSAINGQDYAGATNTISFAPNERLKRISIPILNNSLNETNRNFQAALANPTGVTLGHQKTTLVTILDNDQGFHFESASSTVAEDAGVVMVPVLRGTDAVDTAATVDYAVTDVTAINNQDYAVVAGTLSFAPGEKVKQIPVTILNDGLKEAIESLRLILSNPTGGAVLGSPTTNTVSILDNDPGIGFEAANWSVWENAGVITLAVLRGNDGALGPFTVDYATTDETAKAGQDYQGSSGTLQFQDNETLQRLTIPILPDALAEGTENFRVTLSNPTGGNSLGTAIAYVSIGDNDYTLAPPFDAALKIRHDYGVNLLTWTGGGPLERADRVTGSWQTLTAAKSPWGIQSPIPVAFYRVAGSRPVTVYVPSIYDGQTPLPLVILLHAYTATGNWQESYLQLQPLAAARGFLYCHPDGTIDQWGKRFWNATDGGADFGNTGVDDAGYLRALIAEISRRLAVDPKRIYLIGHSNGGRMAYRMAGESAGLIAGIASLAGMPYLDPTRCIPSEPVNVLHIHGTADTIDPYGGGALTTPSFPGNMPASPGAQKAIKMWAGYNGATEPFTDLEASMDLTTDLAGLDTVVTRYNNHPPGGAVELWTLNEGSHVPKLSSEFSPRVIDWLLAHPKP